MNALQKNPADEVVFRTIINRSYYGAFLIARDYVGILDKSNVHMRVIYYFENNKLPTIGGELRKLKALRLAADYNLDFDIKIYHAKDCYSQAGRIIESVNAPPPRHIIQPPALMR